MNIHFTACVPNGMPPASTHDLERSSHWSIVASIIPEDKVKPSLHPPFSQVVDVMNRFIHALLHKTQNQ